MRISGQWENEIVLS